jgi:hypothetical protein
VPDEEAEDSDERIIASALSYVDMHVNERLPVVVITRAVSGAMLLPSVLYLPQRASSS